MKALLPIQTDCPVLLAWSWHVILITVNNAWIFLVIGGPHKGMFVEFGSLNSLISDLLEIKSKVLFYLCTVKPKLVQITNCTSLS